MKKDEQEESRELRQQILQSLNLFQLLKRGGEESKVKGVGVGLVSNEFNDNISIE